MQNWVGTNICVCVYIHTHTVFFGFFPQIHSAQMFLWEVQRTAWHIMEVVSAVTHLHGDNLGILTREDRLETQPRGKMRSER